MSHSASYISSGGFMDINDIEIHFSAKESLTQLDEFKGITPITGEVWAELCDEEGTVHAGSIEAFTISLSMKEGVDMECSIDQDSKYYQYYRIYDEIDVLESEMESPDIEMILVIAKIRITPEFRGFGLGISAVDRTCEVFAYTASLAILTVQPLQFLHAEKSSYKGQFISMTEEDAKRKLTEYYAKAGFIPVLDGSFMARNVKQGISKNSLLDENIFLYS